MFQFFQTILNLIESGINFIINTFQSVISLFQNVAKGLVFTTLIFNFLPGFLFPIFVSLLGIAILKLVLSFGER